MIFKITVHEWSNGTQELSGAASSSRFPQVRSFHRLRNQRRGPTRAGTSGLHQDFAYTHTLRAVIPAALPDFQKELIQGGDVGAPGPTRLQ